MAQRWGGIGRTCRFNSKRYLRAVRVDNSVAGIFAPHIFVTGRRARCAIAYKRHRGKSEDAQIELDVTAAEAAAGKEVIVTIPELQETITVKIPAGARDGTRLRFEGKGRPGKIGERSGDFYILVHVK
jgi:DnaJ-class molecular chaperone